MQKDTIRQNKLLQKLYKLIVAQKIKATCDHKAAGIDMNFYSYE